MAKIPKQLIPRRGEVYVVNFDPSIGSEIQKRRPAVVLQNNIGNRYGNTTIVAAISSQFDARLYPTEVYIESGKGGLEKPCVVLLNQVRTVDKRRLTKRLGTLSQETMRKVDQAFLISVGLVDI